MLEAGTGPDSVARAIVTKNTILRTALEAGTKTGRVSRKSESFVQFYVQFLIPRMPQCDG